jgi:hypothetical protein
MAHRFLIAKFVREAIATWRIFLYYFLILKKLVIAN